MDIKKCEFDYPVENRRSIGGIHQEMFKENVGFRFDVTIEATDTDQSKNTLTSPQATSAKSLENEWNAYRNKIQNLMYCQLYDLPADGRQQKRPQTRPASTSGVAEFRQPGRPSAFRAYERGGGIGDQALIADVELAGRASGCAGGRSWRARRRRRRHRAAATSTACAERADRAYRARRPASAISSRSKQYPPVNAKAAGPRVRKTACPQETKRSRG